MRITELEWDEVNVEHISMHHVNPQEVEEVCFGIHLIEKEGSARYILGGKTAAGRYLNVVVERMGKGLFRPITAFEMSENYKRSYKKRLR